MAMKIRDRKPYASLPPLKINKQEGKTRVDLFVKSWPPHRYNNKQEENEEKRPLTATLENPQILDKRFIGKIDMSLIRKEFLSLHNICLLPVARALTSGSSKSLPASLPKRNLKATKDNNNSSSIPIRSIKLSEPCKTCNRSDHPERFHSHPIPSTAPKAGKAIKNKPTTTAGTATPRKSSTLKTRNMLLCYLCGREYGSFSFPLHEPKCLEKFQKENAKLPKHLQKQLPAKPDGNLSAEEWNAMSWNCLQMNLVPCENCGRTFLPDRLVVHQKSCKGSSSSNVSLKYLVHALSHFHKS